MKLNYCCLRDTLKFLESELTLEPDFEYNELYLMDIVNNEKLSKYNSDEIAYSIYMLADAEFIVAGHLHTNRAIFTYSVKTITYTGHEFIEKIRSDNVWHKVLLTSTKVGALSVSIISKIASEVISNLINQQLGFGNQSVT